MQIAGVKKNGITIGKHQAVDMVAAREWIAQNSTPAFIDGFMVEGIGIVRIARNEAGKVVGYTRLIDGEFLRGDSSIIRS